MARASYSHRNHDILIGDTILSKNDQIYHISLILSSPCYDLSIPGCINNPRSTEEENKFFCCQCKEPDFCFTYSVFIGASLLMTMAIKKKKNEATRPYILNTNLPLVYKYLPLYTADC